MAYETIRYCATVCDGYQTAHVVVTDGEVVEITCDECGTQTLVPRFA